MQQKTTRQVNLILFCLTWTQKRMYWSFDFKSPYWFIGYKTFLCFHYSVTWLSTSYSSQRHAVILSKQTLSLPGLQRFAKSQNSSEQNRKIPHREHKSEHFPRFWRQVHANFEKSMDVTSSSAKENKWNTFGKNMRHKIHIYGYSMIFYLQYWDKVNPKKYEFG